MNILLKKASQCDLASFHEEDVLINVFIDGYDDRDHIIYNPESIYEACELISQGMSITAVGNMIGVTGMAFLSFLKVHPQLSSRLKAASVAFQTKITAHLVQQSEEGNFNASKFLLINRGTDWTDKVLPEAPQQETPTIQINHAPT